MVSTIRCAALVRLTGGASAEELTVDRDGLRVSGRHPALVRWDRVVAPAVARPGLFWARFEVQTLDGVRVFKGFANPELTQFVASFNVALGGAVADRISHLSAPSYRAAELWDALFAHSRYVRAREVRAALTQSRSALQVRQQPLWSAFASAEQRAAVARLDAVVSSATALIHEANERHLARELADYRELFDTIESRPLTGAQRRACVLDEEHNLVLAGAGTGKTSVMMGRAAYLIASGRARPEQILMLAYNKDAATELNERAHRRIKDASVAAALHASTFHALGLRIVREVEGRAPDISELCQDRTAFAKWVDGRIADLLSRDEEFRSRVARYFRSHRFPYRSHFDFATMEDYQAYVRNCELRTLKGEAVKSFEEVLVANYLAVNGVEYRYERDYEHDTRSSLRRQYRPDFYLPAYRIYLEHFALDERGRAPVAFAGYEQGVVWKRELHARHGTRLLETHSWMQRTGVLEQRLEAMLTEAGVALRPQSDDDLLSELRTAGEITRLAELIALFIERSRQAQVPVEELRSRAVQAQDARQMLLLEIAAPVVEAYGRMLADAGQIDFADMIGRATEYVEQGRWASPHTDVLIDEFQDISADRMRLVSALLRQRDDTTLTAVGDDWQAIYRFSGSDIAYIREFEQRVGPVAICALDATFRYNDRIGAVATGFILRNPSQVRKAIESVTRADQPAVSLVPTADPGSAIPTIIDHLAAHGWGGDHPVSFLVLCRYAGEMQVLRRDLKRRESDHRGVSITVMTAHAAKGQEADAVIITGMSGKRMGFPCKRSDDPFIAPLLPRVEDYPHADERRLFYVALTRARHRAYVLVDPETPSEFAVELRDGDHSQHVVTDELASLGMVWTEAVVTCPRCKDGVMVRRVGSEGRSFYGCSAFPYCRHTSQPCSKCGSPVREDTDPMRCINAACGAEFERCPLCGGRLVQRPGTRGVPFWGCSNYSQFDCRYTRKASGGVSSSG